MERFSGASEPLSSDRLKFPSWTLRPRAADAFCSMVGRNSLTGIKKGATRTSTISTPTTIRTIFKVLFMATSRAGEVGDPPSAGEARIAQSYWAVVSGPHAESRGAWRSAESNPASRLLLPDCLDSGGLEAAVTSDQWQAQVVGRRGDDAVGHVGNNVSWNVLESGSHL